MLSAGAGVFFNGAEFFFSGAGAEKPGVYTALLHVRVVN